MPHIKSVSITIIAMILILYDTDIDGIFAMILMLYDTDVDALWQGNQFLFYV